TSAMCLHHFSIVHLSFHRSGDPLVLPSFPTRRSSDLQLLGLVLAQGNAHLLSAARQLPCVIDHQAQASRDNLPSLSALRFFRWMSNRLIAAGVTPGTRDA